MTDQPPGYVIALVFFMLILTVAMGAAFIGGFILFLIEAWRQHKRDRGEEDSDSGGGGGWNPFPAGPPPGGGGGPDLDMVEFHRELDLIGKTIDAEKEEESVLHVEA
jgi:hypothetical protein